MIHNFTIYTLIYLVTALVSFFVAFIAWQRRGVKGGREVALLMLASGIAAFALIFESIAATGLEKIFWSKIEFISGISIPVLFLLFVFRFTDREKFLSKKHILAYFIIPLITFGFLLTNEKHNLFWSGFSAISESTNLMEYYHGLVFWIGYVAYSYILLIISSMSIFCFLIKYKRSFRYQGIMIFAAAILPWSANVLYLIDINISPGFDITPASITISGILIISSIYYNRFLDLSPVARDTLIEALSDGIMAVDSRNRILDINISAKRCLGISERSLMGLDANLAGASRLPLLNAVLDVEPLSEVEIEEEGEIRTFRVMKHPVKNRSGSRLIVIRDVSDYIFQQKELIKAKERAEESDRLKSAFLANMSHEIRTPMSGILGFTALLQELDISGDEQQEYIRIIEKSGNRMLCTINDIITLASLETGHISAVIEEINIISIIDPTIENFTPLAKEKGLEIVFEKNFLDSQALIHTDKEKVGIILSNLIKNAIKFTSKGRITVSCCRTAQGVEISVKDTGIGIPAEKRELIFERFRQGSESVNRNYEGAGLGLSISKAYTEILGGTIRLESEPDMGSTFFVSIPDKRS